MEKLFTLMEAWLNIEPSKFEKNPEESGSFPAQYKIIFSQSIKKYTVYIGMAWELG